MILPPRGRSTSIGVKLAAVPSSCGRPATRDSSETDGFVHRRSRSRPRRRRRRAGPPPQHRQRECLYHLRDCTIYEGAAAVMLGWRTASSRFDASSGPGRTSTSILLLRAVPTTRVPIHRAPTTRVHTRNWASEARSGSSPALPAGVCLQAFSSSVVVVHTPTINVSSRTHQHPFLQSPRTHWPIVSLRRDDRLRC
jgi:hypothetical protein